MAILNRVKDVARAQSELEAAVEVLRNGGALVRSSHANLSVRLEGDRVAMTRRSTVADLETHDPQALCIVGLDGKVLEGDVDPAMEEIIAMHTRIYQARPDVGAVIHTHAPHLTAFAIAHRALELVHEPMLRVGVTRPVAVVPWGPRGSAESVEGIVDRAQASEGVKAVLLANHGVLAFADDALLTARVMVTLEEAAFLAILAGSLGGAKALPDSAVAQVRARLSAVSGAAKA